MKSTIVTLNNDTFKHGESPTLVDVSRVLDYPIECLSSVSYCMHPS